MNISENGLDFIMEQEGCVLHTYLDSAGIPTIGYGSTMYKDGTKPKIGEVISQQEAEDLLKWEVANKTASISNFVSNVPLNQNQYDALTSFTYNAGIGALHSSTLLKRVKANPSDPTIRDAFLMWDKIHVDGVLVVSQGLLSRRKKEADLYFS
jgi:lysozyme